MSIEAVGQVAEADRAAITAFRDIAPHPAARLLSWVVRRRSHSMSWNTSVLLAEGKSLADMQRVIPDVFSVTKRTIGWEEASSAALEQDIALGQLPGWGVLWTPNVQVTTFPEVLEAASRGGRALSLILAGVSDYYGFCLYAGGKELRRLIRERRRPVEESGVPLPEEAEVDWRDDEDALFDLARRLTGLEVASFDTWSDVRFTVASLDF
jgi:hypothetical protein